MICGAKITAASPSMSLKTSSIEGVEESLEKSSRSLRIPAAVATVLSSMVRVICLVLAIISAHLNLSSNKRASGNQPRSSFSMPESSDGVIARRR